MFGQKTKDSIPPPASVTKPEKSQVRTLLSAGCRFEGTLYSPEYTKIDGFVNGNLSGESGLIIGEKGIINGNISSVEVTICGNVTGDIKTHKLEIKKGGRLTGDAYVDYIIVEYGGYFHGSCKMNEKNEKEEEPGELFEDENLNK
jgi:cytoskeletal protein CcmA (bactofilin family)